MDSSGRIKFKRFLRACKECRFRKVRCDVTVNNARCTNCRLDDKTCVLPLSKRRRVEGLLPPSSSLGTTTPTHQKPALDDHEMFDSGSSINHGDLGAFNIFDIDGMNSEQTLPADSIKSADCVQISQMETQKHRQSLTDAASSDCQIQLRLPPYIIPLTSTIPAQARQYLRERGAFDIPDAPIRDTLLQAYIKWIHPFTPIIDLEALLAAVFVNDKEHKISLLVYSALLFAATAYCDSALGYKEQRIARKAFYERARLLYDFDIEPDRLCQMQSAVLLSFWDGESGRVRDGYYWIGMATLHCNSLGLATDPGRSIRNSGQKRLFNLAWWALLIRDRMMAVALKRPVHNKNFKSNVPMLKIEDFKPRSLYGMLQKTLLAPDIDLPVLERLAACGVALAKLSEYVDKILDLQYIPQIQRATSQYDSVVSLVPRNSDVNHLSIAACSEELQSRHGHLLFQALAIRRKHNPISRNVEHRVVRVHQALLAGYYCMTIMTLYRPLYVPRPVSATGADAQDYFQEMVTNSATILTSIFSCLCAQNLVGVLPDTAIAALESAAVTQLLASLSDDSDVRKASFQRFALLWRVLHKFRKSYFLADTTLSMLDAAVRRLKISPDLGTTSPPAGSQAVRNAWEYVMQVSRACSTLPSSRLGDNGQQDCGSLITADASTGTNSEGTTQTSDMDSESEDFESGITMEPRDFDSMIQWDSYEGFTHTQSVEE